MQPKNAFQPEPEVGTGTTPMLLDTTGLENAIAAAKADITTPVAAYNSHESNFELCTGHGIALVKRAWQAWENSVGKMVGEVANQLLAGLKTATAEIASLVAKRDEANRVAEAELQNQLKAVIRQKLTAEGKDSTEGSAAEPHLMERKLSEAKSALENFLIRVTGHAQGVLEAVNPTMMFLVAGVFGVLYALGEIMLGTEFFRVGGTRLRGIGTSVLVVLMIAAITDIAGLCLAQMSRWMSDFRHFRQHFPGGHSTIHFRSMDLRIWAVGVLSLTFLVAFTAQLLFFRQSLALTSQLVKGNDFAAWVLAAAIWANLLIIFHISPEYPTRLVDEFGKLKAALAVATTEFDAWRQQSHAEQTELAGNGGPVQIAIATYQVKIAENGLMVEDAVQQYQDSINYYLSLQGAYRDTHKLAVDSAKSIGTSIATGIARRAQREKFAFDNSAALATANLEERIATAITRRFDNQELEAAIVAFSPVIPPATITTQFSDLLEALETEIRRKRAEEKQQEAEKALLSLE